MKIAVTGASGFIGEEVLEVLMGEPGTEVIALSRSSVSRGLFAILLLLVHEWQVIGLLHDHLGDDLVPF